MERTLALSTAAKQAVARDDFAQWISRARRLDAAAWDYLYTLTFPQVFRYVAARVTVRQEAEDLTEEVFVGALQSISSLRATDEPGLLGWLFQIARHKLADRLRQRYRRPTEALPEQYDVPSDDPTPEQSLVRESDEAALRTALDALTPEQREVVIMKYVLEYDNARAAQVMGKSAGAINQLQHRALAQLRKLVPRIGG